MRADASEREPSLQRPEVYSWQWAGREGRGPPFILHDGPPYANGAPHMGHALNKFLKDFVTREQIMRGKRVSFIPGWDCHGLPIELKALEEHAKNLKKSPPTTPSPRGPPDALTIRTLARTYAESQMAVQSSAFKSWGLLGDWEHPYVTMDPAYEAAQLDVFWALVAQGHVYRALRPVYWSPSSRTALAEGELEYEEQHESPSLYLAMAPLEPPPALTALGLGQAQALIWTTTPWTLPANQAICVNEEQDYAVVAHPDGRLLLLASARLPALEALLSLSLPIKATLLGRDLIGGVWAHPTTPGKRSPLFHGPHVTMESGTGLVHTAPGHGREDWTVGKAHGLEALSPVDAAGKFTAEAGPGLEGLFVLNNGNKEVLRRLEAAGRVLHVGTLKHKYPYDWRTKQPVLVRATSQWFADASALKPGALSALTGVRCVPEEGRVRLQSFVKARDDWCISRQRAWGVPIPVFYEKDGTPILTEELVKHVRELVAREGTDAWFRRSNAELLPPSLRGRADELIKGTDTMDVWFDSGCSWAAVVGQRHGGNGQADVYLEGSDQHRGWFQSALLTRVALHPTAPYKTLISHGFVLDGEGRKMSKSLGNVVAPSTVLQGGRIGNVAVPPLGADVLRLWVASADYTGDVLISARLVQDSSTTLRKWRNTARFLLGNLPTEAGSVLPLSLICTDLDRYALHLAHSLVLEVTPLYDQYAYAQVVRKVQAWVLDASAFYLDLVKERLYTSAPDSPLRLGAQAAIQALLLALLRAIAPLVPHLAEDIFLHWQAGQSLLPPGAPASVFALDWRSSPGLPGDADLVSRWSLLRRLKQRFNTLLASHREQGGDIRVPADLKVLVRVQNGSESARLLALAADTRSDVFLASGVTWEMVPAVPEKEEDQCALTVTRAEEAKCPRCWKHTTGSRHPYCNKAACPCL